MQKKLPGGVLQEKFSEKYCKIQKKTLVPDIFLNKVVGCCNFIKKGSDIGVFLLLLQNF